MSELLIQWQKRNGFLHRIITGDEQVYFYDNPKSLKALVKPGELGSLSRKRNIDCSKEMLCIWLDQKGFVYYEL